MDITLSVQGLSAIFSQLTGQDNVFWLRTPDYKEQLFVSPSYEKLWQRSCQSLYEQPETFGQSLVSINSDKVSEQRKAAIDNNVLLYEIALPNGESRWMRDASFHLRNAAGEPIAIGGNAIAVPKDSIESAHGICQANVDEFNDKFGLILKDLNLTLNHGTSNDPNNLDSSRYYLPLGDEKIRLTRREAQCLSQLLDGHSSKLIARELDISHRTVELYCDRIRAKFDCKTRLELLGKITNKNIIRSWQF